MLPVSRGGPPRPRSTLRDVAQSAGVSVKTVSRVVHNDPAVSTSTKQRVLAAIESVNYVPNAAARLLRAGAGDAIGLIIDSIADPWFAVLTAVVEEHALARGMTVVIGSSGRRSDRMREHLQRLVQLRCRGVIFAPMGMESGYLGSLLSGVPVVCVDRPTDLDGYDVVQSNDRAGAMEGVQHLINFGHRRIVFAGDGDNLATGRLRRAGYSDALQANGIEIDPALNLGDADGIDAAYQSTIALLHRIPDVTAIFAANQRCGIGVTRALHTAKRTDIAMVAFGDFSLASALNPPITVLDQDPRPIAAKACELLFDRLDGSTQAPVDITLPVHLIQRGSGELRPIA